MHESLCANSASLNILVFVKPLRSTRNCIPYQCTWVVFLIYWSGWVDALSPSFPALQIDLKKEAWSLKRLWNHPESKMETFPKWNQSQLLGQSNQGLLKQLTQCNLCRFNIHPNLGFRRTEFWCPSKRLKTQRHCQPSSCSCMSPEVWHLNATERTRGLCVIVQICIWGHDCLGRKVITVLQCASNKTASPIISTATALGRRKWEYVCFAAVAKGSFCATAQNKALMCYRPVAPTKRCLHPS